MTVNIFEPQWIVEAKERRRREVKAKTGGYRRKPKSQRRKPVQEFQIDYMPLEEALLEIGLANTLKAKEDRAYGHYNRYYRTAGIGTNYRVVCDRLSYHINPGKSVTMTIGRRIVRATQEGKPYSKWETRSVRAIYKTTRGNIAYLFYDYDINDVTGERRRNVISPFDELGAAILYSTPDRINKQWQQVMAAENNIVQTPIAYLRHLAQKEFNQDCSLEGIYPMVRHLGRTDLFKKSALRATTAHEFTEAVFGKKIIRRDLVRAVGKRLTARDSTARVFKSSCIYYVSLFKDFVPTDWLVEALNNSAGVRWQEMGRVEKFNSSFLEMFGMCMDDLKPAERKNLLMDTPQFMDFRDTVRNWHVFRTNDLNPRRDNFKSWKDMHDRLFAAQRERQRIEARKREAERFKPENMHVNKDKGAQAMAFCLEYMLKREDGIRLEIARDHATLFDWSDYMTNCISSYFSSPNTLLGGFYDGDELIANVELRQTTHTVGNRLERLPLNEQTVSKKFVAMQPILSYTFTVNQLLGKNNASLDPDLRDSLLQYLEAAGVKRADRIWW